MNIKETIEKLKEGNTQYINASRNCGDIGTSLREDTAKNGQFPYAVVVTCSDSRVPAEHIFSAGIGEIFVIRTAGNVIGDFELGSVEYGAEHLGARVILMMGHSGCGAVAATLSGGGTGAIKHITDEIASCIGGETDVCAAEEKNIRYSAKKVLESPVIKEMSDKGEVAVVCAKYDIKTGEVKFFD